MGCLQSHRVEAQHVDPMVKDCSNLSARILLLGSGDTGKSTFLKQMKLLHFQDLPTIEVNRTICTVRQTLFDATKAMLPHCIDKLTDDAKQIGENLLNDHTPEPTLEILHQVKRLWDTKELKQVFAARSKLKLDIDSNLDHFFNRISIVATENYVPTTEDMLFSRVKTTGVNQVSLTIKRKDLRGDEIQFQIELIDTGGQKSERRKWLHHFQNVDVVIYFSSLEGYTLDMHEEATNRLTDDLQLFSQLQSMSDVLQQKNWYLFLNKVDLFEKSLKIDPLSNHFPDIPPERGSDLNYCTKYIEKLFRDRWVGENLTTFTTNLLETKRVEEIFLEAQNIFVSSAQF
jgi:GTPase SAR1 family protein